MAEDQEVIGDEQEAEAVAKLGLDVQVEKKSACERHVTVTIAREDVERYLDVLQKEMIPRAEVPGFRAGKAPRKLVQARFKDEIAGQAKSRLLMDSLQQINEEQSFSAISEPNFDLDAVILPDDGPMVFEFDLEVRPDFDLPSYKGLKIERPVWSEEEIAKQTDRAVKRLLAKRGALAPKDGSPEIGDRILADVRFTADGQILSTLERARIEVRPKLAFSDVLVEGFDKLVAGKKAGDVVTAEVQISPDAENEAVRGKSVTMELTIVEVLTVQVPEESAELLESLGDYESFDDVRKAVESEIRRQVAYFQRQSVRRQISALLTASADWELPPDLLRRQFRRELERAVLELRSSGFSEEEIVKRENELRRESLAHTQTALKEHFILERIAEEEKIEPEPADYDREIATIAASRKESARRLRARLESRGMMDALRNQIVEGRVIDLIQEQAKFTDQSRNFEEDDTSAVAHAVAGSEIPTAEHDEESELKK